MSEQVPTNHPARLRIAIIAPSLRYVGGQAVQADLLLRLWRDDPEADVRFLAVDPPLPRVLAWAKGIPGCKESLRLRSTRLFCSSRNPEICRVMYPE